MKHILCVLFAIIVPTTLLAIEDNQERSFKVGEHPRLFVDDALLSSVKASVASDGYWAQVESLILTEANTMLTLNLPTHKVVGRRLLGTSRQTVCRVMYLSYAYKMTGEVRYAERAEQEMLTVAQFSDWNPVHFLDVAEMCAALAIGYDWLYDFLSPSSRDVIAEAIAEKGLRTSQIYKNYRQWNENHNNWNQVCHTGLSLGAIAIWDREPELAREILERAMANIQIPMKNYNPDGAYAEGPGYWEYGTLFNALFIDALESAFGSDFGLIERHEGFQKTSSYICNMITPCGNQFNAGDNAIKVGYNIAPFWFAKRFGSVGNLYPIFRVGITNQRFLPMALLWGHEISSGVAAPTEEFWSADGQIPVATMRSAWGEPNAQFVGVKLGTSSVSHSHLDVGSFIYEWQGVRWATDMGADNYTKLEMAGVDLWNRGQESQRWDVYRYGNAQHNVPTLNDRNQNVDAQIKFDKRSSSSESHSVGYELTALYTPWVSKVYRTVTLEKSSGDVVVSDELTTTGKFVKLDWTVMTEATPELTAEGVLLTKNGNSMLLTAESSMEGGWHFEPAEGNYSFDSPNPGIYKIQFKADLKPKSKNEITVKFKKQ